MPKKPTTKLKPKTTRTAPKKPMRRQRRAPKSPRGKRTFVADRGVHTIAPHEVDSFDPGNDGNTIDASDVDGYDAAMFRLADGFGGDPPDRGES